MKVVSASADFENGAKMTRSIPRLQPSLFDELVVDNFAGGGGASLGMELGLGRAVDIAINHDREAVAMHMVNHPNTDHYCEDVWAVDPVKVCKGRQVGLAWFSPDCKHFSKAKGGKPVSRKIRGLAWIVVKWAQKVKPRVIMLENVEEFSGWGPLVTVCDNNGLEKKGTDGKPVLRPCGVNEGATFYRWVGRLESLGYRVEWRELRACDYGAPTIRKRLFLIARCDGMPIVWPEPTHGPGLIPYRTAAECIDWSIPSESIFERKKPLAENTMRRIAKGLQKFVIEADEPFIVNLTHGVRLEDINKPFKTITGAHRGEKGIVTPILTECANGSSARNMPIDEPARTITAWPKGGSFALVSPTLIQTGYGERPGQEPRAPGLGKPLGTAVAGGVKHAVVAAHLQRQFGRSVGAEIDGPAHTVTQKDKNVLVSAHIQRQFGESIGSGAEQPVGTITAGGLGKTALVSAFMAQHNGGFYDGPGRDICNPLSTIVHRGTQQGLVTSHLVKLRGTCNHGQPVTEPAPTITSGGLHIGEVRAFLLKYYGTATGQSIDQSVHTITSKDRLGLVTVHGVPYQIVDICMRMLQPRELYRAQGFPDEYIINPLVEGKPLTKTSQVRMCGNSVSPVIPAALVRANVQIKRNVNVVRHAA